MRLVDTRWERTAQTQSRAGVCLAGDDRIKGKDKHGWFYADITTPKTENGEQIELEFRTGLEEKGIWDALNPQDQIRK